MRIHWPFLRIIGLTGGVGTGKTTVSAIFRDSFGVRVISADAISRHVMRPGRPAYRHILKHFGEEYTLPSGHLDRRKLAKLIQTDREAHAKLQQCTNVYILLSICNQILYHFFHGARYVVLDAPLLLETRLRLLINPVIVVWAPPDVQVRRLVERDGSQITDDQARKRVESQLHIDMKTNLADYVIRNDVDSVENAHQEVHRILTEITKSSRRAGHSVLGALILNGALALFFVLAMVGSGWAMRGILFTVWALVMLMLWM
ncbi:Dephospho-CoA kinase [Carpediemonas membranifera]|uniref:Dephospho-CoA kinase n=1 Tax=Carpediemonas membranifera TaxID=201153 RepID=A0A8J6BYC6_9EUKA|nr:Dephospho-CoA kinase [Carpediemonas membranifera]|eukprot:KAG9394341.1 Dephospho-CoA kinase [Carpediemonas membranifera]